MDAAWGPSRLGLAPGGAPSPAHTELSALHTPAEGQAEAHGLISLENPLLAVAAIAAITLGFASFSTSGRIGSLKGSFSAGKS